MTTTVTGLTPDTDTAHAGAHAEPAQHSAPAAIERLRQAIEALRAGRPIVVGDDPGRENEIDFLVPAAAITPQLVALLVRHGSGLICAAMPADRARELNLPPQVTLNQDPKQTAYTVLCDAAHWPADGHPHTGISAADRAHTLRVLADPASRPNDLNRPGHVAPLTAAHGGVLRRRGHTEAAVDLAERAGLPPVMALVEAQHDNGSMVQASGWPAFRRRHRLPNLPFITIADLVDYRRLRERQVEPVADARLPTRWGTARLSVWRDAITGQEHVALVFGDLTGDQPVLTRVHSQCLTGDVLGSLRCDCGTQLHAALDRIGTAGRGVLIYAGGHEGRGIGLTNKIAAYALQDSAGADTVQANLALGLPVDARSYHLPGQILTALGVRAIRLLTNNPRKTAELSGHVQVVTREPLHIPPTTHNSRYLQAKADQLGHDLPPELFSTAPPVDPAR